MKPKTIVIAILLVLFLIILLQNTHVVTVQLLFWDISMSRIILLLLMMGIGFVVGYVAASLKRK